MASPNEQQLDIIFYHGAYSLWHFLTQKFNLDIRDVCARVAFDEPVLTTDTGKYTMRVVSDDYQSGLELNGVHDEHLTFMINCVNVVFNMLKEGVIRNGDHILRPYSFQLDSYKNLELILSDPDSDEPRAESLVDNIKLGIHFESN